MRVKPDLRKRWPSWWTVVGLAGLVFLSFLILQPRKMSFDSESHLDAARSLQARLDDAHSHEQGRAIGETGDRFWALVMEDERRSRMLPEPEDAREKPHMELRSRPFWMAVAVNLGMAVGASLVAFAVAFLSLRREVRHWRELKGAPLQIDPVANLVSLASKVPSFGWGLVLWSTIYLPFNALGFPRGFLKGLGLFLAIIAMAFGEGGAGVLLDALRRRMLEILREPWVAGLKARGIPLWPEQGRFTVAHRALWLALPRSLPGLAGGFAGLIASTLAMDLLFELPGLGRRLFNALQQGDWLEPLAITGLALAVAAIAARLGRLAAERGDPSRCPNPWILKRWKPWNRPLSDRTRRLASWILDDRVPLLTRGLITPTLMVALLLASWDLLRPFLPWFSAVQASSLGLIGALGVLCVVLVTECQLGWARPDNDPASDWKTWLPWSLPLAAILWLFTGSGFSVEQVVRAGGRTLVACLVAVITTFGAGTLLAARDVADWSLPYRSFRPPEIIVRALEALPFALITTLTLFGLAIALQGDPSRSIVGNVTPAVVLGLLGGMAGAPLLYRLLQARFDTLVRADFMLAARGHGIPMKRVIWVHLLWTNGRAEVAVGLAQAISRLILLDLVAQFILAVGFRERTPSDAIETWGGLLAFHYDNLGWSYLPLCLLVFSLPVVLGRLGTQKLPRPPWFKGAIRDPHGTTDWEWKSLNVRVAGFNQSLGQAIRLVSGETLVLSGDSGSGKSLLLKAALGVLDGDSYVVEGRVQASDEAKITTVWQHPGLSFFPGETLGAQVQEALGATKEFDLGLENHVQGQRYPFDGASGGEAQRMAILAALGGNIVVMDEPTSALDWESTRNVLSALKIVRARMIVVLASHHEKFLDALPKNGCRIWKTRGPGAGFCESVASKVSASQGSTEDSHRIQARSGSTTDVLMIELSPQVNGITSTPPTGIEEVVPHENGKSPSVVGVASITPRLVVLSRSIHVSITQGEVILVSGTSGSGKSTFLRSIAGLQRTGRLDVSVTYQNVWRSLVYRGQRNDHHPTPTVQYLHQDALAGLTPGMTVGELCRESQRLVEPGSQLLDSKFFHRFANIMCALGLPVDKNILSRVPNGRYDLSGGQIQKIALARALALRPRVVLADEATSHMDPSIRKMAEEWLLTDSQDSKRFWSEVCRCPPPAVLYVSHDVETRQWVGTLWSVVRSDGQSKVSIGLPGVTQCLVSEDADG